MILQTFVLILNLVRPTGLEPAQISPQAPQACAATNYATDALENDSDYIRGLFKASS